ncbi:MAG: hypothetical protein KA354_15420 [Phycisphaerae bacterium]|nr:hypothetical protein [Phycisphaerae bacterium]
MRPVQITYVASMLTATVAAGCVLVNPSNVHLGAVMASPSPSEPGSTSPSVRETAYASALKRVMHQEEKVVKQLQKRDWEDLLEECSAWMEYTRKLVGYADTSQDPVRFRQYGQELLVAIEEIRTAAQAHDANASQAAIRRCDPILDRYSHDFPLSVVPVQPGTVPSDSRAWTPPESAGLRVP